MSSWMLVRFVSTEPQQELPLFFFFLIDCLEAATLFGNALLGGGTRGRARLWVSSWEGIHLSVSLAG